MCSMHELLALTLCVAPVPAMVTDSNASYCALKVQFLEEKMFIGLEHAPPSFDVRGKILGSEVREYFSRFNDVRCCESVGSVRGMLGASDCRLSNRFSAAISRHQSEA